MLWAVNATQSNNGNNPSTPYAALSPDEQFLYVMGEKATGETLDFGGGVTAPPCTGSFYTCTWVAKWRASDGAVVAAITVSGLDNPIGLSVDSQNNVRIVWGTAPGR